MVNKECQNQAQPFGRADRFGSRPQDPILYVSGEESLRQVSARAKRLGVRNDSIHLLAETDLAKILAVMAKVKPWLVVLDSVQTVFHPELTSSPGTAPSFIDPPRMTRETATVGSSCCS